MAIDTHMHINSIVTDDLESTIRTVNINSRISRVINVGLELQTSKEALVMAKEHEKFYASVGIHPLYIDSQDCEELYSLAQNEKVVAIGEIGLDSSRDNYELQKHYLIKQIMIANELRLPVIIHSSNSNQQVVQIFEQYVKPKYGCVFHCFQPDLEILEYIISNKFYISFAGRITYRTAKKSIEVAQTIPNDLFLVETDSPYISPEPYRDSINNPDNIKYIINKLAEIKEMNYEELENLVDNNAKRLFKKIR